MKESIRRMCVVGTAVLLLAGALIGPAAAAGETVKLRYANFPPAPTFPCVQMERWKAEVEKRTAGKVSIDTFPGGTLLGATDMMDGVIAGTADIGCLSMAYQPGRFVITNAAGLPLGIPDARTGSLLLWDLFQKYNPKSFEKVKVLTLFTTAPSNIMSRKPIRTLEDLKGFNLRASGGAATTLKAWGANQVGMPMSDTPDALQKGVVQGLFSSLEVMKDFKFAEHCRFVTLTEQVIYPFAVVMNLDRWNRLPVEVKKVMEEMGAEQAEWTGNYMDNHVKDAIEWSKKTYQVEFIALSGDEKARWDKKLDGLVDAWIAEMKPKGYPAEDIIADIRLLIRKHAK